MIFDFMKVCGSKNRKRITIAPVLAGAMVIAMILSACSSSTAYNASLHEPRPQEDPQTASAEPAVTPAPVLLSLSGELYKDNYLRLRWEAENSEGVEICAAESPAAGFSYLASAEAGDTSILVHLKPGREYKVRVACLDKEGKACSDMVLSVRTEVSVLGASFWPNRKLPVFDGPYSEREIGEVCPGERLIVLSEYVDSGRFKIRLENDELGYVDSDYCMVNLPDYLGDLCSYDIKNSYCSAFTIHEFEIPGVSGEIIPGYESVRQSDGCFLVPLLYPSAVKLASAANMAESKGYRLKIYDAYRPRCATYYLYESAKAVLNDPVPEESFTGRPAGVLKENGEKTLKNFLVAKGWKLGSFLAKNGSTHNMGTALDLTLEYARSGSEIAASTLMHDLSIYSTVKNGNDISKQLYEIMTSCGFVSIQSEWWHFQDSEIMKGLNLAFCDSPVS